MMRPVVTGLALLASIVVPAEALADWSRGRLMSATPAEQALAPEVTLPPVAMSAPSLSADGRYVAFSTVVRNLFVGGDQDLRGTAKGGLLRREVDGTEIAVVAPGPPLGSPGLETPRQPSVSADGRYVAFTSTLALSPEDDDGGLPDVYVRDMQVPRSAPGAYDLASPGGPDGARFRLPNGGAALSADGQRVLVADDTNAFSGPLHVRDRLTRSTFEITPTGAGAGYNEPALSADGSTVIWVDTRPRDRVAPEQYLPGEGPMGGLPANDPRRTSNADLLWRRIAEPVARRVAGSGDSEDPGCPAGTPFVEPVTVAPQPPRDACDGPFSQQQVADASNVDFTFTSLRLSADGNRVAWLSNLEYRGGARFSPDASTDVFTRDMTAPGGRKATTREWTRFPAGASAESLTLDPTGTSAALATPATVWPLSFPALISSSLPPAPRAVTNVYAIDLQAGLVERVTQGYDGNPITVRGLLTDVTGQVGTLSAGGQRIAFATKANNVVFGDANGIDDVFVADRFSERGGALAQEPYTGASGDVAARVFPVWRLSVTVSKGGRVLYVDARVPGAGVVRATARSRNRPKGRRVSPAVAVATRRVNGAATVRIRLTLRKKYLSSARRSKGLPVRVTVRFTPRATAGRRSVTTLERVRTSTYRVKKTPARGTRKAAR